jgi:uncharacterized DUF497 family protein
MGGRKGQIRAVTPRFAWDPRKASTNLRKHGVSFWDAHTAFRDPLSITTPDPEHSAGEDRFLLVGLTRAGRLVVVAFAERRDEIRLISARVATHRERTAYEEGK